MLKKMLKSNICLENQKSAVSLTCQTITNNTNFKTQNYGNFNQLIRDGSSNNGNCKERKDKWSKQRH